MHSMILQILYFHFIVGNSSFTTIVDKCHTITDKFISFDKTEYLLLPTQLLGSVKRESIGHVDKIRRKRISSDRTGQK